MDAKELMVGDWLNYKGIPVKVVSLEKRETATIVGFEYKNGEYDCDTIDKLSPIPLTPEILEKNGFSGKGYNMGIVGFRVEQSIPDEKDGYEVFIWKDNFLQIEHGFTSLKKYIKFVHELQHALRICGIKKDIVL